MQTLAASIIEPSRRLYDISWSRLPWERRQVQNHIRSTFVTHTHTKTRAVDPSFIPVPRATVSPNGFLRFFHEPNGYRVCMSRRFHV